MTFETETLILKDGLKTYSNIYDSKNFPAQRFITELEGQMLGVRDLRTDGRTYGKSES